MNFGIIAAGEGSRLAAEGISLPKPLVEINGVPLVRRLLDIFGSCGAETVAVVTNSTRPETAVYLHSIAGELPFRLEVREAVTPSSMHTFAIVGDMLRGKGRFIATTVDTVFNPESFRSYAEAYEKAPSDVDGMMAVTRFVDDEKPLYVTAGEDMQITGFLDAAGDDVKYISAGIYGLCDKALGVLGECLDKGVLRMRNFQRALVAVGLNLRAYDIGTAVDVDHAGDLAEAEKIASAKL